MIARGDGWAGGGGGGRLAAGRRAARAATRAATRGAVRPAHHGRGAATRARPSRSLAHLTDRIGPAPVRLGGRGPGRGAGPAGAERDGRARVDGAGARAAAGCAGESRARSWRPHAQRAGADGAGRIASALPPGRTHGGGGGGGRPGRAGRAAGRGGEGPHRVLQSRHGHRRASTERCRPLRTRGPAAAARRGAVAALVRSLGTLNARLPHTGATKFEENGRRIPAAAVAAEDAELLHRLLAGPDPVRVHLAPHLPHRGLAGLGQRAGRGARPRDVPRRWCSSAPTSTPGTWARAPSTTARAWPW